MRVRLIVALCATACLFGGAAAQARSGSAPVLLVAKPITMATNHAGERTANLMICTANEPNLPWIGAGCGHQDGSLTRRQHNGTLSADRFQPDGWRRAGRG